MKTHSLKIWPIYYEAVKNGSKTYEVRDNDREFSIGDIVILKEFGQETKQYTGRQMKFKIGFVVYLLNNYCVFSLLKPGVESE